jgi:DNA-binding NarL/FixJ family response regulator
MLFMSSEFIRILLVENNVQDTALFSQLMETNRYRTCPEMQYSIRTMTTLNEGVKRVEAGEVDVVVIDLLLPDTTPNEILAHIEETSKHMPIVALTSEEDIDYAIEAIRHGAQDYLVKSRTTGDLIERAIHYAIERKKIEKKLDQANAEMTERNRTLNAILENVPEGITITGGPPDYPVKIISHFTLGMTGRPPEKLIGVVAGKQSEAWAFALPDGTKPKPEQMPLYRAARFGEEPKNVELLLLTADGRKVPIIDSAAPIHDDEGNVVAAINVWRDISEIKGTQRRVEDYAERLKRSNTDLQQFAHIISHDLKQPLSGIIGFLSLLEKRY